MLSFTTDLFAEMNRHHFALFIRNCRLILLLRREFGDGDLKSFRPAEFRWKLPQVSLRLNSEFLLRFSFFSFFIHVGRTLLHLTFLLYRRVYECVRALAGFAARVGW